MFKCNDKSTGGTEEEGEPTRTDEEATTMGHRKVEQKRPQLKSSDDKKEDDLEAKTAADKAEEIEAMLNIEKGRNKGWDKLDWQDN